MVARFQVFFRMSTVYISELANIPNSQNIHMHVFAM